MLDLDEYGRSRALSNLPRHTIEPVFHAYCGWRASNKGHRELFESLMEIVPDLDMQIDMQCSIMIGDSLSLQAWEEAISHAAYNPQYKQQLATALLHSLAAPCKRALAF